ncbi:hypothetical protein ACE7GA_11210 [Roseomonas sp. CCTCC AB2023176]|uniref:hypothetical protein n=1 Tax=Roseomonas sp. CCTCC AB2023176 TaxID=3342640 RepID=UPI0035D7C745
MLMSDLRPAPFLSLPDFVAAGRAADARRLSDRLLRSDSAVRTLQEWCEERCIGEGRIRLVRAAGEGEPTPPGLLGHLEGEDGEIVRHRRVVLTRGAVGLSDCDLWWLPGRLPRRLAEALDTTDHPFGLIVAPMRPRRRTVFVDVMRGRHVLEHQVVVEVPVEPGTRPVAVVRERYRLALARLG